MKARTKLQREVAAMIEAAMIEADDIENRNPAPNACRHGDNPRVCVACDSIRFMESEAR